MKKIAVGVLGATGIVGQQYLALLESHPWFEVTFLAASERSAGQSYEEAVQGRWHLKSPLPKPLKALLVHNIEDYAAAQKNCQMVFSALSGEKTAFYEEEYARCGLPVVSNASAHRKDKDVPMIIPEVNAEHLEVIPDQQRARGFHKGFIVVKPNCSLQSYLTPLYALKEHFGLQQVFVASLQAISGAGHPGVPSLDIMDNVIPYISEEEEKSQEEPLKILGRVEKGVIVPAQNIKFAAHCSRVPVSDGHLACVSAKFDKRPELAEVLEIWDHFTPEPILLKLPSAPAKAITYHPEADRPQPKLDRDADRGMAVHVGRLRNCPLLDIRFVGLSHNTLRGAAGGGILNAELLLTKHYIR